MDILANSKFCPLCGCEGDWTSWQIQNFGLYGQWLKFNLNSTSVRDSVRLAKHGHLANDNMKGGFVWTVICTKRMYSFVDLKWLLGCALCSCVITRHSLKSINSLLLH